MRLFLGIKTSIMTRLASVVIAALVVLFASFALTVLTVFDVLTAFDVVVVEDVAVVAAVVDVAEVKDWKSQTNCPCKNTQGLFFKRLIHKRQIPEHRMI
jgi:hypothetical protein